MSDHHAVEEDAEFFSSGSALWLALVSLILYWFFLRPTPPPDSGANRQAAPNHTRPTTTGRRNVPDPRRRGPVENVGNMAESTRTGSNNTSEAAMEVLLTCPNLPPHVAVDTATAGMGGCNILLGESGLVAFGSTSAGSAALSSSSATATSERRQERANILSRLLKSGKVPPSKGSTVVFGLEAKDILSSSAAPKLSKILYAMATFYNVVVIVGVDEESSQMSVKESMEMQKKVSQALYEKHAEGALTDSILPLHRVLVSSTVAGRIALVRQLSKVSLVVDWDSEVDAQLTRFGYQV
eukprot:CAMPEP_0176023570 /NCGR_PEP_ID=MMETSP0120_2-20121206/11502_1 /TAXON_ID=160619 /ORGANISM="Kryptoperidinium foliaceum, Strain CCMP 1326" /LENGTH=296 /DNA_ID=CAMNT_0017356737 /DNA_START=103 /DNA_END=989 /DNA_ORIENTATION=-